MSQTPSENEPNLYEHGKAAVRLLWKNWKDRPQVNDPQDPEFARGALEEIIRLLVNSDDVYKEIREYSEAAAEQLTKADRTILEVIQNADDLEASTLKMSVRRKGKGELLAVHDGRPVVVTDVIAMTLAFLSMKRDDARSKGRFGIGLKTLNQIGAKLSVHCPPYHFAIEKGVLHAIEPARAIKGLYQPSGQQTLLAIDLDAEYGPDDVVGWIRRLDASHLVFLDHLRSLSLIDRRKGSAEWEAELVQSEQPPVEIEMKPGTRITANCTLFSEPSKKGRIWTRYSLEYPVPLKYKRAHKATAKETTISVAISESAEPGILAAGLPLDFANTLPISLNAQFDPDLSRRGVRELRWNEWLFGRLAALASGVAMHRFQSDARTGWQAVPLLDENVGDEDWTQTQIVELIETVQDRIRSKLQLAIDGDTVRLSDLSYLSNSVEVLLTLEDQKKLQPEFSPLPNSHCDKIGRWRQVLDELKQGHRFTTLDALRLLELDDVELGQRPEGWFLALADAALQAGYDHALSNAKSVLAADGSRYCPNGEILLVRKVVDGSIAERLGLEVQLAAGYFSPTVSKLVQSWLEKHCVTDTFQGGVRILDALSRRSAEEPLYLDDKALLTLRDALQDTDDVRRLSLAATVGKVICVNGYEFRKGKKVNRKVQPALAYLPTSIAKDTLGWAAAAKSTEELFWIDNRYAALLRKGTKGELSAKKFFSLLGAKAGPILVRASDGPHIEIGTERPATQVDALRKISRPNRPTHLRNDYVSPDLDRVVANIAKQRIDPNRRARAQALIVTLDREWEHNLSEHAEAGAEYFYYTWRHVGHVPATWLARAASERWLSSKSKRKVAPRETAIETATTRLTRGNKPSQFVHELKESDSASPLVAALEIKGTPPASELIAELEALRREHTSKVHPGDVYPLYAALASLVSGERAQTVGDIAAADIRSSFENAGLLLTNQGWTSPSKVYRGRPIFGKLRIFVQEPRALLPLWQMLQIFQPSVEDCIGVLQELGDRNATPDAEEKSIIVDVLRRLAESDGGARKRDSRKLLSLPLWTSQGWQTARPIYAVTDETLEQSLGKKLPLWAPHCALQSLGSLPEMLGVDILTDADFSLSTTTKFEPADEFTELCFRGAVSRLRATLAKKSQELWNAFDWKGLESAQLFRADDLSTTAKIASRRVTVSREVHVEGKQQVYFANPDEIGAPEAGRAILVPFVDGDLPEMVDFAWSYAWHQAEDGSQLDDELNLASEDAKDDDPLEKFEAGGKKATGNRLFAGGALGHNKKGGNKNLPPAPKPRRLKDFDGAVIAEVTVVQSDKEPKGIKPKKRPLLVNPKTRNPAQETKASPAGVREWTEKERERRGFELLAAALKQIDNIDLDDYSALKGIGADSMDNLSRYFELKVFSGEATDEVRFEHSEFQRAVKAKGDYFLAVVSGLEEGRTTEIMIFADPIRTLDWKRIPQIRLGGIRSGGKSALRIRIDTPEN
ncbi:sacsin N-terminal ATP-binding-like domain-containing protein [Roseibium marinum]|uniref:sacsin N-terminal ATP-binding-like domain-containing protein n=1 Tax=Roseibium marinum TaxID=281252 RepID=UPI0011AF8419|nr:hypothetical protein [Roseibium marinum]